MGDKVVIVVGSKDYEVTKSRLADRSRYFNSMFNGDFLEKYKSTVNIKGIASDAWEEILFYLDTGKLRPKPFDLELHRGVLRLLLASDMLLFHDIRDLCVKSLLEILMPENAIEILEVAEVMSLEKLIQKSKGMALWHGDIVTYTEDFYYMDINEVENYLSDPRLHISAGEKAVWEAIERWIIFDDEPENPRVGFMPRLIKCLSLRHLTLSDLKTISLHEGVRTNEIVSGVLNTLIENYTLVNDTVGIKRSKNYGPWKTVASPEINEFIESWRSKPKRKLPCSPAVIGKIVSCSEPPSPYVLRFDFEENIFTPFLRLDQVETNLSSLVGFKVVAHGCKLYMLGGEIMSRQASWYLPIWEYDQIVGQWNYLTNLRKEVRHASVCILGNDLYVIGGFGRHRIIQNSVSKLSLIDKKWTECAPLPRPMYAVPCCAFRGKIYAIKSEVYEYCPETDKWEVLDLALPANDVYCVAVANNDFIYIAGLQRALYKFDPTQPEKRLYQVGRFGVDCTQACLVDNYMYSVAQSTFGRDLTCERIHVRSGKRDVLWKAVAGNQIDSFGPNHHHGCFPLLTY